MSDPTSPIIKVYSSAFCPYCGYAKRLLKSKNIAFEELRIDESERAREEMEKLSGRRSVPQIFIGDFHVGGYDDLAALDRSGKLDPLLGLA